MFQKVSIIVPVYNCEKYISKCLESILRQTYTNIEVIIVNDGSIDSSEEIIKDFISKDNRILYIKQNNSGPSEARNKGILKCTGDYLMFVDSDDTVSECYVEYMLNEMINHDYDIVCCGYKDISRYGVYELHDFSYIENKDKSRFLEMTCNGTGGVLWSKILKKDIIDRHNIYLNKDIFMCEDLVFILEYISKCKSFGSIDKYLYNYNRLNDLSISSNLSIGYVKNHIDVCINIEDILKSSQLNQMKIDEIVLNRIQNLVISLLESQSAQINKNGFKVSISNMNKLISEEYIRTRKDKFSATNIVDKPYVLLIKINNMFLCSIYGVVISTMKKIRRNIKYRKVE